MDKKTKLEILEATLAQVGCEPIEESLKSEMEGRGLSGASDEPDFIEILEELEGFGPIKKLLADPSVSEVLINSHNDLYYERRGALLRAEDSFASVLIYERFIKRILVQIDKVADRRNPIVDGTLEDGTRAHIVLPPISRSPLLSLRRHAHSHWNLEKLIAREFLTAELGARLRALLVEKSNILICGPTGAGKTTLLRALIHEVKDQERIITVEDTDEIGLRSSEGVSLLTRVAPDQLVPTISLGDLLKTSLRMRPDRIVVGEIRGEEALVFLDAISTGHRGSMSSIHANSARQALTRLESLVSRGAPQWPISIIRQMIYESIDLIICVGRNEQCRRITEISELAGIENFGILLNSWDL